MKHSSHFSRRDVISQGLMIASAVGVGSLLKPLDAKAQMTKAQQKQYYAAAGVPTTQAALDAEGANSLRVSQAFQRAWEKPDAEELASFFSNPASLKYGAWANSRQFSNTSELTKLFSETIAGGRTWRWQTVGRWVRGRAIVEDVMLSSSLPGKPEAGGRAVYVVHVRDGKIRQWFDFGYRPA